MTLDELEKEVLALKRQVSDLKWQISRLIGPGEHAEFRAIAKAAMRGDEGPRLAWNERVKAEYEYERKTKQGVECGGSAPGS